MRLGVLCSAHGFGHTGRQLPVVARLLELGHKVAICEQLEDPSKVKGIVKRAVVRVFTPALVLDGEALTPRANQFLAAHPPTLYGTVVYNAIYTGGMGAPMGGGPASVPASVPARPAIRRAFSSAKSPSTGCTRASDAWSARASAASCSASSSCSPSR